MSNLKIYSLAVLTAIAFLSGSALGGMEIPGKSASKDGATAAVSESIKADMNKKTDEVRRELLKEADAAIQETKHALDALNKKETGRALASLERAVGKLSLILARDPNLALAPIGMETMTYDVYSTLDAIQESRRKLEDYIEDGRLPEARRLLDGLASEIRIRVTNIPLASYPAAIKAVPVLIDGGKIDEAKLALEAALNTLIVTERIIPLPVVRAEGMLKEAKALAEKKNRSESEKKDLEGLLADARDQLKMGKALGYGARGDFNRLFAELDDIETKTAGGKYGKGFFSAVNSSLSNIRQKMFKQDGGDAVVHPVK